MQDRTYKVDYTWEKALRFLHSHINYKIKIDDSSDFYTWYDANDWYIYSQELNTFLIVNFKAQKYWIMECSIDYFSKDKGTFVVELIDKYEQELINNDVNKLLKNYVPTSVCKAEIVSLRDVKPGQEFYFVSDATYDTCVSYGKLPNGRYFVVNMCESPDSNYGEFPGDSEVCLIVDKE